jgi:uroporphyrinogen III methyltransferase/synthase
MESKKKSIWKFGTREVVFAAIGPVTAQTAREIGLPVTVEADEHTTAGLVRAVAEHYRR